MSAQTITTPRGGKIRTARSTRYVVVVEAIEPDGALRTTFIEKGTSNLETARTHVNRKGRTNTAPDGSDHRTIVDLRTGEYL